MNAGPTTYTIRIDGHLDEHWAAWLGGAAMVPDSDGTTTMTISIADQAQLHGLLARLRDLGAVLLDLHASSTPGTDDHSAGFSPAKIR